MEWYYILGAISYGIFIIQFLLSLCGFIDTDLDVDFDGSTDFSISDLISFKGLIHFTMGFSGWLMITQKVTFLSISVAVLIGFMFIIILYIVYKVCMKFNYEPKEISGEALIGKQVTIYLPESNGVYRCKLNAPVYTELTCYCEEEVQVGDIFTIVSYKNGIYYISK